MEDAFRKGVGVVRLTVIRGASAGVMLTGMTVWVRSSRIVYVRACELPAEGINALVFVEVVGGARGWLYVRESVGVVRARMKRAERGGR